MDTPLNIGQAAKATGLSAKMIRHYESVGLMPAPARTESGYRLFDAAEVSTLKFIRQARDLGFALSEIAELLALWRNRQRPSREVKALAQAHIKALDQKVQELLAVRASLDHLVQCCQGDERPECPILAQLATDTPPNTNASTKAPGVVRRHKPRRSS